MVSDLLSFTITANLHLYGFKFAVIAKDKRSKTIKRFAQSSICKKICQYR